MNINGSFNEKEAYDMLNDILDMSKININFSNMLKNKNIILYGAGNLGTMAIELLKINNIIPKFIVDKKSSIWGQKIENVEVISPDDIKEEDKENCLFAVCIVKFPFNDIKDYLTSIGCKNIVSFWDVTEHYRETIKMSNGWYLDNLSLNDNDKIREVYEKLEDDISRIFYIQVLYWRIRREEVVFSNYNISSHDIFFPENVPYTLNEDEYYLDCGAYKGEIIDQFLKHTNNRFQEIMAFEPDPTNYKLLIEYVNKMEETTQSKTTIYPYGLGDKNDAVSFLTNRGMACRFLDEKIEEDINTIKIKQVKIDDFLEKRKVTFMKIHGEGMECKILAGGIKTIMENRPIVAVTIYHNKEGIMEVPLFLMKNLKEYKFYHRLYSYCGNDSVLYAVPKERINNRVERM